MNQPWPDPDNPVVAALVDAGAPDWLRAAALLAAHVALGIILGLTVVGMLATLLVATGLAD